MQLNHYCSNRTSDCAISETNHTSKLFLDIETTGLTSDLSAIFMIGCGYIENNHLHTIQWLADGPTLSDEQEILQSFSNWADHYFPETDAAEIITYNGQTFDLPFLKSRYAACKVNAPKCLNHSKSLDLYRELTAIKHFLPVKNLKLKTVSSWLGYTHANAPSGRQLIKAYQEYIKTKDSALLNLLFLHNIDDLESLFLTCQMQAFIDIFHGNYKIISAQPISDTHLQFDLKPSHSLPMTFEYQANDYVIRFCNENVQIQTKVYSQGIRYYYSDFKNYVYLPVEDHALHKSMAKYIDKSHYVKATADTCYTWFIPDLSFFESNDKLYDYIQMIFQSLRLF